MRLFLLLTLPLFAIDQITKSMIVRHFPYEGGFQPVIEGFFNLVRVHNRGIAFGSFNSGPAANIIFSIVAFAAMIAIVVFWRKGAFPGKLNGTAVALLLSGIFGNLTDRLFRGYVVDFLDFHIGDKHWPSFNVADSCICIAAGLLFIAAFRPDPSEDQEKPSGEAAGGA